MNFSEVCFWLSVYLGSEFCQDSGKGFKYLGDTVYLCLKPLSLTPSRPSRFSANGQNFKTFSQTRAERKGSLACVDQGNDSKTWESFGCFTGM